MTTANTIESFFSLINRTAQNRTSRATSMAAAPLSLRDGATLRLPADRHITVVTGRVWLTHHGDSRDHFPKRGDSFDTSTHSDSVIQALADSTILIQ